MSLQGRRRFVAGMGAAFAAGGLSFAVRAAMGPEDKFDLLIKGGEVFDPSQNLRAKRDIGMRFGRIEAVEDFAKIGFGKGGYWEDRGYEWYAGI